MGVSTLSLIIATFKTYIVPILLYECETWLLDSLTMKASSGKLAVETTPSAFKQETSDDSKYFSTEVFDSLGL